jgi:NADPH:quinone reductase-like Zn-dependent oxidoreductase
MKAVRIIQWGQPLQVEDIPQPQPASDEVLVRVRAASLNPVDRSVAAGYLQSMLSVPMTAGTDLAGEVVEVGAEVKHVRPGEAVYGMIPIRGGGFAEYAVTKANEVAPKPQSLDYVEAASVPLTALSAWQALDTAQLQRGERVLIQGAAGNVGRFAAQLAKEKGAFVIGTGSSENIAFLQELGVDQVINYQEQRFEEVVDQVDVVLDTVGGEVLQRSYESLKPGGRLITLVGQPSEEEAGRRGIQAFGQFTQPTTDHLTKIAELIDAGRLKVFISRSFPLEEAQAALEFSQQRNLTGKTVLIVN